LQADLVSESHLRGKIESETSEFSAAAHSYATLHPPRRFSCDAHTTG
jgi:hypothetical protein